MKQVKREVSESGSHRGLGHLRDADVKGEPAPRPPSSLKKGRTKSDARRGKADGRRWEIAAAVSRWFLASGRELPWRTRPRNPYLSLLSEFMLQQTQVSRVLEKYGPFVERFPTVESLAAAALDDVLAMWSGMGYYRRARNLHAAAKNVVERFGGRVPENEAELMTLPGVGRYTAGAVASIAFNRPTPIVDGNVARVLMRVEGRDFAHGSTDGLAWAWKAAEGLVGAGIGSGVKGRIRPCDLNEGLMELGAVVCTPRSPACPACPLETVCRAAAAGKQGDIPRPKVRGPQSVVYCETVVVRDGPGRIMVERRSDEGMWAGLWQAPTWERHDRAATGAETAAWLGAKGVGLRERFVHQTTHREVRFSVWTARDCGEPRSGTEFLPLEHIAALALSSPQRRILLGNDEGKSTGAALKKRRSANGRGLKV